MDKQISETENLSNFRWEMEIWRILNIYTSYTPITTQEYFTNDLFVVFFVHLRSKNSAHFLFLTYFGETLKKII